MPRSKKLARRAFGPEFETTTFETDAQIEAKLADRFQVLSDLAVAATIGEARGLIISGPAGLGKSYTVEKVLEDYDPSGSVYVIVKGYVRPTAIIRLLHQYRHPGNVVVFDDADSVFFDDVSLNLLKAACDTTEKRIVSYMTENPMEDEDGGIIPKSFQFDGTVIFITNMDFDKEIDRGSKLAPHFTALISRSHYMDLAMKTKRDYLVRIRQVIRDGLLTKNGCSKQEEADVVAFIEDNVDSLRELSLRMAIKLACLRKSNPDRWERTARVTCCRNI